MNFYAVDFTENNLYGYAQGLFTVSVSYAMISNDFVIAYVSFLLRKDY